MAGTIVGLRDLYYAILTKDDATGVAYDTPQKLAAAIQANINPNPSSETLFADDGPLETAATLGNIELELQAADFPLEKQAILLGHSFAGGVMIRKAGDTPPWVAIGFRSLKSNGKYRYVWMLKGKFQVPEQRHETKSDQINFQVPSLTGQFVKRDYDDAWQRVIDEDSDSYVPSIGTNWFLSVDGGAIDTAPPTATVSPADSATGVAVSSNVVWTFDKLLAVSCITRDNFMVLGPTGAVDGALTYVDGAGTTVTFDPTANLAAATEYTAIVTTGVKSRVGVPMAAVLVTKFTTA